MSAPRRIVVIGAGLAAVSTCDALRAGGYDGDLMVFSAEEELPYDRPPLSKDVLLGKAGHDDILLRPERWYRDQAVELRPGTVVTSLRPETGTVEVVGGAPVTADRIVLATGGTPRPLPVPGGADPAVHVLRTWADTERLRQRLRPGARVAVVGAGLIGAETAAAAAVLGCRVTLIDPVAVPLAAVVGVEIARVLHARHTERGIEVVTGGVERIGPAGVHVTGRTEPVRAEVVVVGIGIRPATALAEAAGLRVDNGIVVDPSRRTSHPHVFAVGDVARHDGHRVRHEHWQAARHDGEAAAAGLLGRPAPQVGAPWFWSDRHGSRLEAVGTMGDADRTVLRGSPADAAFTTFGLRGDRLVAAASIDRPRDIKAAQRLIDRDVPVDPGQLSDASTDLRKLVPR
ncbi:NAD(P)/FAD-dependent oxidoreductase [Embleya sp. AB8]|uniref:NAD(P)/FAD-dependent oxidoreductase n=1 Tax=Embleya sp. AB8 TaxID=3156304 RepID=UPI003C72407E